MTPRHGVIPTQRQAAPSHVADQDWTTQGLCGPDPDALFVRGAAQREVARLCRKCPVQRDCLADALDNRIEWGVWGGMTERERRALLRRRPEVTSWRQLLLRSEAV